MRWNGASIYWLIWIGGGFFPYELWSLITNRPQNTLSYQFWHLDGTGASFGRYFVGAFFLWLFIHMTFRMFR